jgi:hypothetical protein
VCNFFSCISDGNGKVLFFTLEDVVKIMVAGNPKDYGFNSHTSIAHYNGIEGANEDKWNKWEYNPTTKVLTPDSRPAGVADDSEAVKKTLIAFFDGKYVDYMQNLYNSNSGNSNSGNSNSGNWNSGDCNSGDCNSGDSNSGNCNSGNRNSGNCNSGDSNSGNCNSGNRNSGDWNSGDCNSGILVSGFNSKKMYFLFNKKCKETDYQKFIDVISAVPFMLTEWVYSSQMTEDEKKQYPNHAVCDGYLRKYGYKEAWKNGIAKCSPETIKAIKKLKNFNAKVFEEITGVKI